jgi:hypothetical protein
MAGIAEQQLAQLPATPAKVYRLVGEHQAWPVGPERVGEGICGLSLRDLESVSNGTAVRCRANGFLV